MEVVREQAGEEWAGIVPAQGQAVIVYVPAAELKLFIDREYRVIL